MELESAFETGVGNIKKFAQCCKCRLRQKRHREQSYANEDAVQAIDILNIPDHDEEEFENPETNIDVENNILTFEITVEDIEMPDIESPETTDAEFENDVNETAVNDENYSEYVEEDIFYNTFEINEKTEEVSQGYSEFNVVSNDNEELIQHDEISEADNSTAPEINENSKIQILENIIIKPANNSNFEISQASDVIALEAANYISNVDLVNGIANEKSNNDEKITDGTYKMLEANNKIVLPKANEGFKIEQILNLAPEINVTVSEGTSTEDNETVDLPIKSDNENTEKPPIFDNFKVPKKVTRLKKKKVAKNPPQFILTHVIGGHIIQESNYAFPIRQRHIKKPIPENSNKNESTPTELKDQEKIVDKKNETEESTSSAVIEEDKIVKEAHTAKEHTSTEVKKNDQILEAENISKEHTPAKDKVEEQIVQEENKTEEPIPTENKIFEKENGTEEPILTEDMLFEEENETEERNSREITIEYIILGDNGTEEYTSTEVIQQENGIVVPTPTEDMTVEEENETEEHALSEFTIQYTILNGTEDNTLTEDKEVEMIFEQKSEIGETASTQTATEEYGTEEYTQTEFMEDSMIAEEDNVTEEYSPTEDTENKNIDEKENRIEVYTPTEGTEEEDTDIEECGTEELFPTDVTIKYIIVIVDNGIEEYIPTEITEEPDIDEEFETEERKTEEYTQTEFVDENMMVEEDNGTGEPASTEFTDEDNSVEEEYTSTEAKEEEKIFEQESGIEEPVLSPVTEDNDIDEEENGTEELTPTTELHPAEVKEEEMSVEEECRKEESASTEEKEKENELEGAAYGELNPFARLQHSAVEAWTIEDLSRHLLKFNWEETASFLQDNEVDGAALLLVKKAQLLIIGVDEKQADIISDFVQSGSSRGN